MKDIIFKKYMNNVSIYHNLNNEIIIYLEELVYFEYLETNLKSKKDLKNDISELTIKINIAFDNMLNTWINLVKIGYFKNINICENINNLSMIDEDIISNEARKASELTENPYPPDTIANSIWGTSVIDIHEQEFEVLGTPRAVFKIINN